jgi:sugar phosphate isomerase/epimerase
MIIALSGTATMYCNLLTDIRIAKETGYDAIEIRGSKLFRYLDQGLAIDDLLYHLGGFPVVGLSFVQDIERQAPGEYTALLEECERMCGLAETLGCQMVQLVNGPVEPGGTYKGLVGQPWPEIRKLTARNLAALADIGAKHGVSFYLETPTWAPLHTLKQALEVIDATERANVGLVVDFWHYWCSGVTPEEVANLRKEVIQCVHLCDGLERHGERGHPSQIGRGVWTGGGRIPLREWVDAVLATGFDGWWSCEFLSPRHWELDPWRTALLLKDTMKYLMA